MQNRPPERSAGPRQAPPWWPADEAWPPRGAGHLRLARALFRIFLLLAILAGGALIATGVAFHHGGFLAAAAVAFAAFMLTLMFLMMAGAAFGTRRARQPLNELIEAVRAVERGQYTARLQWRWGPPAFRQLTSAFNTMTARLDANERQRRTLLADISHELRNPLTVLQGELEAMVDGVHPADTEHLERALDETRVLARLIDDLRTLALAETDALPLHREAADLGVLVTEAVDSFRGEAERGAVELTVSVPADVPLVDIDPIRIREVLSNLLANALRYAPAGTAVAVSLRHDPQAQAFEIEVVDHGPGIDPTLRDHVFDRFVKSETSRGSGLGLAIARELVRAHAGRIEAGETPGGGTTMRVSIPLATARQAL